jgi:anti-sigma B factor antagonist
VPRHAWARAGWVSTNRLEERSPLTHPIFIAPEGELDAARVGEFRSALSAAAAKPDHRVVVDLSQLEFIDSSGLGALVETHNRLRRENRQLAVIAPGGTAAAVLLNLSGLQARLPTYETREAATKHTP